MHFKDSLWDDSDPAYAPCRRKIRGTFYWVAPPKYTKAGYSIKTYALGGEEGDGQDLARALQCRELTRNMMRWYDGETKGKDPGTWSWIFAKYIHDSDSTINDVQPLTRENYKKLLHRIEEGIGRVRLAETDYHRMRSWISAMESKGRSADYIKRWFRHAMLAVRYGAILQNRDCIRILEIRRNMRIKGGSRREFFAVKDQVDAIVDAMDRDGLRWASLSVLLLFETSFRTNDVIGKWEPAEGRTGGIVHRSRLWVDGLTWDMLDDGVTCFTKLVAKTKESQPESITIDLTLLPDIRSRILEIPEDQRVGPLIKCEDGMPPKWGRLTRVFKNYCKKLELPEELQLRDLRSGGITEAGQVSDNPIDIRNAAQHTQMQTTNRYLRNRTASVNKVIELRQNARRT